MGPQLSPANETLPVLVAYWETDIHEPCPFIFTAISRSRHCYYPVTEEPTEAQGRLKACQSHGW